MAASKVLRAGALGVTCFALASAVAFASCSRSSLQSLIPKVKTARDQLTAHPSTAYEELMLLDRQVVACREAETDKQIRFKLTLVEVGLRAYMGAADASRGNLSRGNATAQAAMQDAKRLVRDNRSDATNLQLAQQLVTQCERPLAIIGKLSRQGH
jgi:hypothetical protein